MNHDSCVTGAPGAESKSEKGARGRGRVGTTMQRDSGTRADPGGPAIYVESWDPELDPAYRVDEALSAEVELAEEPGRVAAPAADAAAGLAALAFVDGVRRREAWLVQVPEGAGQPARGLAGSLAAGAAVVPEAGPPVFSEARVERLLVWGGGAVGELPEVAGGWRWRPVSVAGEEPLAPLDELQARMRALEAEVAGELVEDRCTVVVDGTLEFRLRRLPRVAGLAKTHHRRLLPPELHARVPELAAGERSALFTLGEDRYSCYLRLAPRRAMESPWDGVIRIEVGAVAGVEEAGRFADGLAAALPRFAGVPHRDPRAPQNLQPVGALEAHLRRRLGSAALARRAVRDAVARLAIPRREGEAA